eukprot:4048491-Amphidinium_carterae.1
MGTAWKGIGQRCRWGTSFTTRTELRFCFCTRTFFHVSYLGRWERKALHPSFHWRSLGTGTVTPSALPYHDYETHDAQWALRHWKIRCGLAA